MVARRIVLLFLIIQSCLGFSFTHTFAKNAIGINSLASKVSSTLPLRMQIASQGDDLQSRRSTLQSLPKIAMGAIMLSISAPSAYCKVQRSNDGGRWANHFGEFTEDELSGFEVSSSGLKFKDVVVGEGAAPVNGQSVSVHYAGYLAEDGAKFDASYERGKAFTFHVGAGEVIKGWDEAVAAMHVGGRRIIIVPPALGYGNRGAGGGIIPPGASLIFYVELLAVGP